MSNPVRRRFLLELVSVSGIAYGQRNTLFCTYSKLKKLGVSTPSPS